MIRTFFDATSSACLYVLEKNEQSLKPYVKEVLHEEIDFI